MRVKKSEVIFCQNFRKARREKDLSQTELGRLCNMSAKMIGNYEIGQNTPTIEQAVTIANALNMSLDELCETEHYRKEVR